MRFEVPAGNSLVFSDAAGAPLVVPEIVPLSRTIESAPPLS